MAGPFQHWAIVLREGEGVRSVRRILLIVGSLGALLVIGALLFLRTAQFQALLHAYLVSSLNATLPGDVSLGRVEGSVWQDLQLTDFIVRYEEKDVVRIPRLTVRYALRSLLTGQVHITHIDVHEPVVRLVQDAAGNWNLVKALVPDATQAAGTHKDNTPGAGVGMDVVLNAFSIHNATIEIALAERAAASPYRLHDMTLEAHAGLEGERLHAVLDRFAVTIAAAPLPPLNIVASAAIHGGLDKLSIDIPHVSITSAHSQLQFAGQVKDLNAMALDGTLSIQKLAAADLAAVVPGWPVQDDISGEVRVTGTLADMHTDVTLAVADAALTLNTQADLSQSVPSYAGTMAFSRFDMAKLLGDAALAGIFEGSLEVAGQGADLAVLTGATALQVQALRVGAWHVGDVGLHGTLKQQVGEINGTIVAESGQANWSAAIQLADELAYTFKLVVDHLDLQKTVPGVPAGNEAQADTRTVMTSDLNLSGTVQGKGMDPSSMDVRAVFDIAPSSIGPIAIYTGRLDASVADGKVDIADVRLKAQGASVTMQGELGTTLEDAGRLSYQLNVTDFSPWLALADQKGTGRLTLAGEAEGNLADLHVTGALQTQSVALEGYALSQGTVEYNLTGVGREWPQGRIQAELAGLNAGIALQSVDAQLEFTSENAPDAPDAPDAPGIQMTVHATDTASRHHHLDTRMTQSPDQLTVSVNALALALPGGVWELVQPASVLQRQGEIAVNAVQLRNGDQRIFLDGRVSTKGAQDFQVRLEEFAVAGLRPLISDMPNMPAVSGVLSTHMRLSGTAQTPIIKGNLNIDTLKVEQLLEQPSTGLSASFAYQDKRATLDLTFEQDAQHSLQVSGTLPLSLHWQAGQAGQAGLTTEILGDMDARAWSSGLSLAFLNALSGEGVSDIAGELSVDMRVRGPLEDPFPQGTVTLRNGRVAVSPLGIEISDMTLALVTDPETIRIEELSAVSGKGKIEGQGALRLLNYVPQDIDVALTVDTWPAIHTGRYEAEVGADVRIHGALTAPHVSGRVEVLRAALRPDLAFLDSRPINRDETILIIPVGETASSLAEQYAAEQAAENRAAHNTTLDLTVRVQRDTRIKHANASIDLAGEVKVTKEPGAEPRLVGDIEVVRGWAGFQGRRFTLDGGKVRFTGGKETNPTLDIVAQYQAPEHVVEAVVRGTAREPTLVLRSDPKLEQADILAVLLFGKPASALDQGEKLDLEKQALAITGGYAAAKIGESVSQALGLEKLGVGLQNLDIVDRTVGFGLALTKGLHVSVAQDLTKKGERKVSLEYQLSPHWQIDTSSSSGGASEAHISWQKKY